MQKKLTNKFFFYLKKRIIRDNLIVRASCPSELDLGLTVGATNKDGVRPLAYAELGRGCHQRYVRH